MARKLSACRFQRMTSRRWLWNQPKSRSISTDVSGGGPHAHLASGLCECGDVARSVRSRRSEGGACRADAIVATVADQPFRERCEEAVVERGVHEADFRGRSAGHVALGTYLTQRR